MSFYDWLLTERHFKPSTARQYDSLIRGKLSDLAMAFGFWKRPLTTIKQYAQFAAVADAIRDLTIFKNANETGGNLYAGALKNYERYLRSGGNTASK